VTQQFRSVCDVEGCDQPALITLWGCLVCEDHGNTNKWRFTKVGSILRAQRRD
jgi:hypothetical protein